jgi:hypothetical protein
VKIPVAQDINSGIVDIINKNLNNFYIAAYFTKNSSRLLTSKLFDVTEANVKFKCNSTITKKHKKKSPAFDF